MDYLLGAGLLVGSVLAIGFIMSRRDEPQSNDWLTWIIDSELFAMGLTVSLTVGVALLVRAVMSGGSLTWLAGAIGAVLLAALAAVVTVRRARRHMPMFAPAAVL